MVFVIIGFGYVLCLALLIRFFQTVHRWDEEIEELQHQQKQADLLNHAV